MEGAMVPDLAGVETLGLAKPESQRQLPGSRPGMDAGALYRRLSEQCQISADWCSFGLIMWRPSLALRPGTLHRLHSLLDSLEESELFLLLRKLRRFDAEPHRRYARACRLVSRAHGPQL